MTTLALFDIMHCTHGGRVYLLRYMIGAPLGAWTAVGTPEYVGLLNEDRTFSRLVKMITREESVRGEPESYKPSAEEHARQLRECVVVRVALNDDGRVTLQRMRRKGGGWIGSSKRQDRAVHVLPIELSGFSRDVRRLAASGGG